MTDWYYHDPGKGRVGPLTAEEMRQRYRERLIARDTLAWHDGLREWQPLERLLEELGLTGVQPDARLPPPLPSRPAAAMASHAGPMRGTAPPRSNTSGCLIVAIVLGVVGLVLLAILAAIALPAYRDYVERTRALQGGTTPTFDAERMARTEAQARTLIERAMGAHYGQQGICPDEFEFETEQVRDQRLQGDENGWFLIRSAKPRSGLCAYDVEFYGLGPELTGKTVRYEVTMLGKEVGIVCNNNDLPPDRLPPGCGG